MSPEELLKALRNAAYKKTQCPMIHIHDMKSFAIRHNINPVQYYSSLITQPDKVYAKRKLSIKAKPTSQ